MQYTIKCFGLDGFFPMFMAFFMMLIVYFNAFIELNFLIIGAVIKHNGCHHYLIRLSPDFPVPGQFPWKKINKKYAIFLKA